MFFIGQLLLWGIAMIGFTGAVSAEEVKQSPKINIVFDLGGVVVETNKWRATQLIGLGNIISYRANPRKPFFNFLDSLVPRQPNCPYACDETGNVLPQLMCDWMTGARSGEQIAALVRDALAKNTTMRKSEKKIFYRMNRFMFGDIELFLSTKRFSSQAIAFIRECKQAGYGLYVLSNWDKKSMEVYKEQNPEFFELFDGVVVSGEEGMIKPDPNFFSLLLERYNLDPATIVFIDDQKENIEAAQSVGLFGIQCLSKGVLSKSPDFKSVRIVFEQWKEGQQAVINPA